MDNKTAVKNLKQVVALLNKVAIQCFNYDDDCCEAVNTIWKIIHKLENPND